MTRVLCEVLHSNTDTIGLQSHGVFDTDLANASNNIMGVVVPAFQYSVRPERMGLKTVDIVR